MGRPYKNELAALSQTLDWAATSDVATVARVVETVASRPLIVIGSGGSVTACDLIARLHAEHARQPVRVSTPFEFSLLPSDGMSSVLLLSAGGANRDILRAAKKATADSYENVCAIVARSVSPLSAMLAELPHTMAAGFNVPFGKDGFLAVNSLLATSILVARAYASVFGREWAPPTMADSLDFTLDAALRPSIVVLAAGWSWPAALDLESKFNEAGLGTVVCTDYRNFAHGRHHGLARRASETGVIALSTPDCQSIADRTLRLIPTTVPRLHLVTNTTGSSGAIDLITRGFHLVGSVADCHSVDPGKPHVAEFGRRLYGLPSAQRVSTQPLIDVWVQRKVSCNVWNIASDDVRDTWREAYRSWANRLSECRFSGVALDYDGTLCEAYERAGKPRSAVIKALAKVLSDGLRLGIATGRGDSVLSALRAAIPVEHHADVVVGLYNGAIVGSMQDVDQRLAAISSSEDDSLSQVAEMLQTSALTGVIADVRRRYSQLTIKGRWPLPAGFLYRHVLETLSHCPNVLESFAVNESGHSIDVTPKDVSKLAVVAALWTDDSKRVLTIGDQGQFRGNDYAFLARPESLSVERVSTALDQCWNVALPGSRGTAALTRYLGAIRPVPASGHRVDVSSLEEL